MLNQKEERELLILLLVEQVNSLTQEQIKVKISELLNERK